MQAYDKEDAALYDYYSAGLAGDVEFYVEQARRARSGVLEIGCGTGRILFPIAEAGIPVVGLDRSSDMLALAAARLEQLPARVRRRVTLVQGDARRLSLDRRFKLVMVPYRAFMHLLTPADQRKALRSIRRHLEEGGRAAGW